MAVLSDRDIRAAVQAGRVRIDPYDASCLQPSSVDLHLDREFRVFRNNRYPYIDVRQPQPDLTEIVAVGDDDPFILHPGEFVLGQTLEWVELPDDLVARLEGKALALDTPVPTPVGWRTMGELEPGDYVFDERGAPTQVIEATAPMLDRPCREVLFSNGERVVADAQHQWVTIESHPRRMDGRDLHVRTTDEIARTLTAGGEPNHLVPFAGSVRWSPPLAPLSVELHAHGEWVPKATVLIAALSDVAIATLLPSQRASLDVFPGGAMVGHGLERSGRDSRQMGTTAPAFRSEGREWGQMGSSVPTDVTGSVKSALGGAHDAIFGSRLGTMAPTCPSDGRFPAQRVPREAADSAAQRFHSIADVREVASVPVRCIQVASPRGVFLVSRSFIPTHNSSLGRLGLLIHSTAGYVDPGWKGNLTLELSNVANLPIALYFGMKIGQISFFKMSSSVERPYGSKELGSKYQGQSSPTASEFYRDFSGSRRSTKGGPRRKSASSD